MAKKQITVCDRCPPDQDVLSVDTVTLPTHDGLYQADVCENHLLEFNKLEGQLQEWVKSARLTAATVAPAGPSRKPRAVSGSSPTENTAIRAWCRSEQIAVPDRGRIPEAIRQRWRDHQAHTANNRWSDSPGIPTPTAAPLPTVATG